jgi:hypothetical protein
MTILRLDNSYGESAELLRACSVDNKSPSEFRFASILPSKFFGEISGPPTAHNQSILRLLLTRTLSSLRQLVLPFPDHVPTLQLFKSVTPDVESWRFTHVQATPALLQMVAEQRPNLRNLEYSIYPSLRPTLSLKTCEVAVSFISPPRWDNTDLI